MTENNQINKVNEINEINEINDLYYEVNKKNLIFDAKFLFKTSEHLFYENNGIKYHEHISKLIRESDQKIFTDETLLKSLHDKIMSNIQMIKNLLTYEFLFYTPENKISDQKELMSTAKNELFKYQGTVGGCKLEDVDWIDVDCQSSKNKKNRFKLKPNQIAIYNTMNRNDSYDSEQIWFIKSFTKHMKKFIKNDSLSFYYKMYDDESNDISWILFICEDDNNQNFIDENDENDENEQIEEIIDANDNELKDILDEHEKEIFN